MCGFDNFCKLSNPELGEATSFYNCGEDYDYCSNNLSPLQTNQNSKVKLHCSPYVQLGHTRSIDACLGNGLALFQ